MCIRVKTANLDVSAVVALFSDLTEVNDGDLDKQVSRYECIAVAK